MRCSEHTCTAGPQEEEAFSPHKTHTAQMMHRREETQRQTHKEAHTSQDKQKQEQIARLQQPRIAHQTQLNAETGPHPDTHTHTHRTLH